MCFFNFDILTGIVYITCTVSDYIIVTLLFSGRIKTF